MSQNDKDTDKDASNAEADAVDSAAQAAASKPVAASEATGDARDLPPESAPPAPEFGPESRNTELYGILAEFDSPGELIAAAKKVRDAGFTQWDCYSPFPVHGLDPAMGIQRTILPWIVFAVGLCGLGGGLLLQWWANAYNWPWIVSGKPFFSLPANIPITFETTILASVFASFFGMWGLNKLPQWWSPLFKKDRFLKATDDAFFIGIEAADARFQRGKVEALLREAGAVAVETCYTSADPGRRAIPRPLFAFILITMALALVPFGLIAKARSSKSTQPHVHIVPDMDFQAKKKSQRPSDLFHDGRASRAWVDGTVARGTLQADDHLYRGIVDGQWATTFPDEIELGQRTMERGQNRFAIYCQPCHGADGKGVGMVHQRVASRQLPQRGWVQPSSLHQEYIVKLPHGQLFNTISNGIRSMPGYAAQIPEVDRWAITLYVRALQRSQNANLNDVPPDARGKIR